MQESVNRRDAVRVAAIACASVFIPGTALADRNPDAALVQIEANYLAALEAACDASGRVDEYDAPSEIKFGPRIQIREHNGYPGYAYDDAEVEEAIGHWLAEADADEKREAEMNKQVRELVQRAREVAQERGRIGTILSPEEKRSRALAYRPAWEQIKRDHAAAIAKTDLPRLEAEVEVAWNRVREIEERYISTPAHGPTGYAVKVRLLESWLRDYEYAEKEVSGRILASLMRDLQAGA